MTILAPDTPEAPATLKAAQHLCVTLATGGQGIPLDRIRQLVGYATLAGEPDDYFLGWLTYHGQQVPVFDLNRIVCDEPTPPNFGARILLLDTTPMLGLLAAGATDTSTDTTQLLDLDAFLPMLYPLIPA